MINANGTRANAGERPPVPGIPMVLAVPLGELDASEDAVPKGGAVSLHPEADALPLAEAEVEADVVHIAEATEANISAPIMDSPTNISSLFTLPPSGRLLLRTSC
jgi:hypothetical protein